MTDNTKRIQEMLNAFSQKGPSPGGITALVQMLGQLDRQTERQILTTLERQNPELARNIRDKYFTFDDIVNMEDKVLKRALEEVHRTTLALALKGTTDTLMGKVFKNVSDRAVRRIKEEMDMMGPKPRSLVDEAQREVTKVLVNWRNVIL